MSVASSMKLLKLGASSSHLSSGRLSSVRSAVTCKLRQDVSQPADSRAATSNAGTTNPFGDRSHKQNAVRPTGEHAASEQLAASRARSSSPVSSIRSSSFASNEPATSRPLTSSSRPAAARSRSATMGSSSSKCTKITDPPPAACAANQNGWLACHNNNHLPPQLTQPFLHHSSSMINLTECVYCHPAYGHHDATLNYPSNPYGSNGKLPGKANYLQQTHGCALSAHCCPAYACHFAAHPNAGHQTSKANRDFDSTKDPYWLQQAKKSNKLARKDQKFGLFSRNLLGMGINETQQQSKFAYHTKAISGMELLREPGLNKDLAYTHKEREKLGIKGLIPPAVRSQELQARIAIDQFRKLDGSLKKYMYLRDLQDFNKRLFYRLLIEYVEELMPIVYTPVVGDACLKYSELYKRPRGLFITKNDIGHVHEILDNWPEKDIKAIVVTDGERILGLGDLGANGMGIPVGKLALYSALAAIPPHLTLPVTLDVGTNNEKLINSEYYIGLKEPRERGPLYDKLLDEFMEAVVRKWGRTCLIQFEDFGNSNAFKLLQKYRNHYCTFNDDIQGTASVAVAGVLAACKRMKKKISQQKFLFMGAGGAALGISDLLVMAMETDGLTKEQAIANIFLIDSKGLVSKDRENETDPHKMLYAKQLPNYQDLEKVVDIVKPSCLIGVCAQPAVFTPNVLRKMAQYNESPLIFPLSNPTSKAECTAEQAYVNTDGKCIFASGSPFDIFKYKNQTFIPGQGNNSYIFPGIALAVMACSVHTIPEETFLVAARALADQVTAEELAEGRIYPCLKKIQQVSVKIATKTAQYFFSEGLSTIRPEPEDKELFIRQHQYVYEYDH